jgi:hypothetical protein
MAACELAYAISGCLQLTVLVISDASLVSTGRDLFLEAHMFVDILHLWPAMGPFSLRTLRDSSAPFSSHQTEYDFAFYLPQDVKSRTEPGSFVAVHQ